MGGTCLFVAVVVLFPQKLHNLFVVVVVVSSSAPIVVNQDNLAYLAALFPESELVREQLLKRRLRNKQQQQQQQPPTPINTDPSFNDAAFQSAVRNYRKFGTLLSMDVISTPKDQVLFLLVLVSCLL